MAFKGPRDPFSSVENRNQLPKHLRIDERLKSLRIEQTHNLTHPRKGRFVYHGDERTVPPLDLAISYSSNLPYHPGMPGPSNTWSCYANSVDDAIRGLHEMAPTNNLEVGSHYRMAPIILERLDESLIILSHHLEWSIADVINVVPRKVLFIPLVFTSFSLIKKKGIITSSFIHCLAY
jgi:hypothetical protein